MNPEYTKYKGSSHEEYGDYCIVPCPLCAKVEPIFFETVEEKTRLVCREEEGGCGCSTKWLDEDGLAKISMPNDGTVKGELVGDWWYRPFAQIYMVHGNILPKIEECALIFVKGGDGEWAFLPEIYNYKNGNWIGQVGEFALAEIMEERGDTEFLWVPNGQLHRLRKIGVRTDDAEASFY